MTELVKLEYHTIEKPEELGIFLNLHPVSMTMKGTEGKSWTVSVKFVEVERTRWWRFKQWLRRLS